MMINFSKVLFTKLSQICITGIKCNYDNIIKVVNIFACKWLVLTIDSVMDDCSFLIFIRNQGLEYNVKQLSTGYKEISVVIPHNLLNCVLEKAISEDPENIFIFNLFDLVKWDEKLQNHLEMLVAASVTDMSISVSLDENSMSIFINKSMLSPRMVYKKIRSLQLE